MADILSHAEVEALLSGIKPSSRSHQPIKPPAKTDALDAAAWESHDFRRPQPVRGAALQVIHALHSGFGFQCETQFAAMFQAAVQVRSVGVCQSPANDFLETLPPGCIVCHVGQIEAEPSCLLVWSAPLAQSLFTRMLGGKLPPSVDSLPNPMTSIERRLLLKLNEPVLIELSGFLNARLKVAGVFEGRSGISSSNMLGFLTWLSFEVTCGGIRGVVHLGISQGMLQLQSGRAGQASNVEGHEPCLVSSQLPYGIQKVMVEVSAVMTRLQMRTSDLATLQVGDILMTDHHSTDPIFLRLDDRNVCRAAMGSHSGYKALRLTQSPEPPARDSAGYIARGSE